MAAQNPSQGKKESVYAVLTLIYMSTKKDAEVLKFLLNKGKLDREKIAPLLEKIKESPQGLGEILLKEGLVSKTDWLAAKGRVLGFEYVDLESQPIDDAILQLIPEDAVKHYKFVPFERTSTGLKVGMVNPEDEEALEALRFLTTRKGLGLQIFLVDEDGYKTVLKRYENLERKVEEALTELEAESREAGIEKRGEGVVAEPISAEAPISKIVAVILRYATESRASDIHIEPLESRIKVRFRIDGILHSSLYLKKEVLPAIVTRVKILSRLRIDETRVPQDGRFSVKLEDRKIDFRVSLLPTYNGEKVVMRVLDPQRGIENLEDLGLVGRNLEVIRKSMTLPNGMILASGPTGSGKTTTLYSILEKLNRESVNIISLEDPIEYFIEGINQSQIRPEIGYSFASGLRHVLRQDPDIILVGEIRDKETASLAVHAALTGHLLLSSIHTNDALGIVPRLIDMGIERFLVPSSLSLGLAQRLARKLCPDCRKQIDPSEEVRTIIERELAQVPEDQLKKLNIDKQNIKVWKSPGCKECANKGTKGRIGIFEVFEMTPVLEEIITGDMTETKLTAETKRQGMITMFQDGIIKVIRGVIGMEELMRVVSGNQ